MKLTGYLYIDPYFTDKPANISDERLKINKWPFIYNSCPLV
jgi:hypothetical protein